jgi:hypothetical protein
VEKLPLVLCGLTRADDHAAHAPPGQGHVHDVAADELGALGREVVEGLAQGPGRDQRYDADSGRPGHREIMAYGVGAACALERRDRGGQAQACAAPAPSARASASARSVRSQVNPSWSRPKWP